MPYKLFSSIVRNIVCSTLLSCRISVKNKRPLSRHIHKYIDVIAALTSCHTGVFHNLMKRGILLLYSKLFGNTNRSWNIMVSWTHILIIPVTIAIYRTKLNQVMRHWNIICIAYWLNIKLEAALLLSSTIMVSCTPILTLPVTMAFYSMISIRQCTTEIWYGIVLNI